MPIKKLTPAQQQYMDLKSQQKDALLFFRMGDFYEMFYDDAKIGHQVLGITLTARDKNGKNPIPMAGIPYHALDRYLPKLINAGYKVAIAEQVGLVTPGKVVDREIVRVVTPATYIGDSTDYVYIGAVWRGGKNEDMYHCAWGDFSLGSRWTKSFDSIEKFVEHSLTLGIKELVIHVDFPEKKELDEYVQQEGVVCTIHDCPGDVVSYIKQLVGTSSLEGYGKALQEGREYAMATLFSYIEQTQKQSLRTIDSIAYQGTQGIVQIDPVTLKNLEIFQSSYEGSKKHALLGVINTCKTALGTRELRKRLTYPSRSSAWIAEQQGLLLHFSTEQDIKNTLSEILETIPDIPKVITTLAYTSQPLIKLQLIRSTLLRITSSELLLEYCVQLGLNEEEKKQLLSISSLLDRALIESDEEATSIIKQGFDDEVDTLSHTAFSSDSLLLAYHQECIAYTGVQNIKIKFITNQGYFLEITNKDIDTFHKKIDLESEKYDFVRRQTLKSGQRYVSTYLNTIQEKILHARDALLKKEKEIIKLLVEEVMSVQKTLHTCSQILGIIDVCVHMSTYICDEQRSLPTMNESNTLSIVEGRHPVVEHFLPSQDQFIPNSYETNKDSYFHLITGPNMGGKSTYLRQNALIVLLAHAGLPVPAKKATIPIIDALFARVGSGDALAKNQSTFMTEMIEMANIVNNATSKSFVVLDELGRGTSTYDGLSLAKALCVYLCQKIKSFTLFATHYHELLLLEESLQGFSNRSVGVYETDNDVVFLKKIVPGGVSKSYGLDVAKIAGVPESIITNAHIYLKELTVKKPGNKCHPKQQSLNLEISRTDSMDAIKELINRFLGSRSINEITPIESLLLVQKIVNYLEKVS